MRETFERAALAGDSPVLLTSPDIRPYVRSIIERFRGQTPVMSQNEVHPRARLKTVGHDLGAHAATSAPLRPAPGADSGADGGDHELR